MNEPKTIREMLAARTIAVVGLSDDPTRASYRVAKYMQYEGYRILPVNPSIQVVLGEKAYPSLASLPIVPDVVNVFRLPSALPTVVNEIIALGWKQIWIQQGIVHPQAAAHAAEHGIHVVMDRCIMLEHANLQ